MSSEPLCRLAAVSSARRRVWLCMLLVAGLAGCFRAPNRVTGTVRLDGQPLTSGRVTFLCDGKGRPAISGNIASDGSYAIDDPPVRRAMVSVETFKVPHRPKSGVDPFSGIDYEAEWIAEWGDAGPYVPIPSRYASPTSSGLEMTIVPGVQAFDIELSK